MADVKVGDLFVYSWGYDQTNVDFFEVIEKKTKSFVMRAIAQKVASNNTGNSMACEVSPIKGAFLENAKPILKTSFSMPHGMLSKTHEENSHYNSWYA